MDETVSPLRCTPPPRDLHTTSQELYPPPGRLAGLTVTVIACLEWWWQVTLALVFQQSQYCIIPGRSCGDWHFKVTSKPFGLPVEGGVVNQPGTICTLDFLSTAKCFGHLATGHLTLQQFQMRLIITMCVVAPAVLRVLCSKPLR